MKRYAIVVVAAVLLAAALSSCGLFAAAEAEVSIGSFGVTKADNAALGFDSTCYLDQEARTIRIFVDPAVTDYSALVPRVEVVGEADLYPASGSPVDFTQTPVTFKLVTASGSTVVYYATIDPKPVDAEAGALRITEYFCGTGTGTSSTGELNRYLELYNGSSSAVDLAQFRLVERRSRWGKPDPSLDQSVWLKGTIAANSYYVIYSNRANLSLLAKVAAIAAKQSDSVYNGIMDGDGASSYELWRYDELVDAVGPNDGSSYAASSVWYRRSVTATGLPRPAAAHWNPSDWASAPVGGLLGDDGNAGLPSLTSPTLTSLFVESGDLKVPATIDEAGKTATVLMPDGANVALLSLSVGGFGTSASVGGSAVVNGTTVLDFSAGSKTLRVEGQDGTSADYSISVIPRYTTANYDFDGGIQTVVDKIWAGGSFDTPLGDVYIEGIVTAKNIYPKAFVIQDRNAGIYFYTGEGIAFPVGSRVRVLVSTGKVYYGLPEVTLFDSAIEAAGAGLYSIYYQTGDYANQASVGKVFRYEGAIAQGGLSYYKGQFAGSLYFHYPTEIQSFLSAGTTGVFYGPVSVVRENYTMELVTRDQFTLR